MSVKKYFTGNEFLKSSLANYRQRDAQIEIALVIENSMNSYKTAVIEAPTGSGKTFAYLIPTFASGHRVIIATKTKQLMKQLIYKDIPTINEFLGEELAVKEMLGRKNYFCPSRFYRLIMPHAGFYAEAINWYERYNSDDITLAPWGVLDNDVCNLMTADRYQCAGSKCQYYSNCPFYIERDYANKADVIVTNHHLLLADVAMKAKGGLQGTFEYRDNIIFDEAHSIPDIYSQYAGAELSLFSLSMFFKENRAIFSMKDVEEINSLYFQILTKVNESKILYNEIRNDTDELIAKGRYIVENAKNNELLDEYKKFQEALKEIHSDKEGVRIVEKQDQRVSVRFIPFDNGVSLVEGLKLSAISSVFISATISSAGNFDYFLRETGLDKETTELTSIKSVFSLHNQAKMLVPEYRNDLEKDKIYIGITNNVKGSVLIICNSIGRMWQVGELLKAFKGEKRILFQMDVNLSELNPEDDIILIGCATLREGIDLSGCGFKCVILDKLPFEYFKDFYLESKAQIVERDIGNSFMNFYLPRAVLYFKQAIGRLIRHEDDFGIWVVLDDRILNKSYGKYFLDVVNNVEIVKDINIALKFIAGGKNETSF